jgi:hypothetical protein
VVLFQGDTVRSVTFNYVVMLLILHLVIVANLVIL